MLLLNVHPSWVVAGVEAVADDEWLKRTLSVTDPVPDAYTGWATTTTFYEADRRRFPTGLLGYVLDRAKAAGIATSVKWDENAHPLPLAIPLEGLLGPAPNGKTPRDYQIDLVVEALTKGRGIVKSATASGKTAMMGLILRALGNPKALILVGGRALVHQIKDEVSAWLGEPVGYLASKKSDLVPNAVVALVPSLAAHADDVEVAALLESRRTLLMDECLGEETSLTMVGGSTKCIGDVAVGDRVATPFGSTARVVGIRRVIAEAIRLTMEDGSTLTCSPGHPFAQASSRRPLLPAAASKVLYKPLSTLNMGIDPVADNPLGYLYGLYCGDGMLVTAVGGGIGELRFSVASRKASEMEPQLVRVCSALGITFKHRVNARGDHTFALGTGFARSFAAMFGLTSGRKANRLSLHLPTGDKEWDRAVLAGLFDTDGYRSERRVALDLSSEQAIEEAQAALATLGVEAIKYTGSPRHSDRHSSMHRLTMYGANVCRFNAHVGFRFGHKNVEYVCAVSSPAFARVRVLSSCPVGARELVDIELEQGSSHMFVANGFATHNCHHCAKSGGESMRSGSWHNIAMACVNAANRYGFSATALKVGDVAQNWRLIGATGPVFQHSISGTELVSQGFAAQPCLYYMGYKKPKGNLSRMSYKEAHDACIVKCAERNTAVVTAAKVLFRYSIKSLVLVERIDHAQILYEMLKLGLPEDRVNLITGAMELDAQQGRLDWLRQPGERVMVSTRVLGEGTDVPDVGAVIYARGRKSYVQMFQGIGRAMRSKGEGGGRCIIVDFIDVYGPASLKAHYRLRRVLLSGEEGYMVAAEGMTFGDFVREVLSDKGVGGVPGVVGGAAAPGGTFVRSVLPEAPGTGGHEAPGGGPVGHQ